MQLRYGSYPFDPNSCIISSRIETQWNAAEQPYANRVLWAVEGWLSTSQATATLAQRDITAKMKALQAALAKPNQDLILFCDDGSPSNNAMPNAGSISGVRITRGPDYTSTAGPEYAVERRFSFEAEAEYPLKTGNFLLDFQEQITIVAGGPVRIMRPSINTDSQRQLLYPKYHWSATQEGSAKGYRGYPAVPAPLWPGALKSTGKTGRKSPRRRGSGQYEGYEISWSYEYESITPLLSNPNLWK